jgi:hypothetical protein
VEKGFFNLRKIFFITLNFDSAMLNVYASY